MLLGEKYFDTHIAKDLLEQDLLEAVECDPPKHWRAKELYETRAEYQEFKLKTFSNHLAQQVRRFRQFPGWQKERNEQARESYLEMVARENQALVDLEDLE